MRDEVGRGDTAQAQRAELFQHMLHTAPTLAAAIHDSGDSDAAFEDGLRMLIDGIAAHLDRTHDQRRKE
jgi:hypothetical protein